MGKMPLTPEILPQNTEQEDTVKPQMHLGKSTPELKLPLCCTLTEEDSFLV